MYYTFKINFEIIYKKKNTFEDYIFAAKYLIENRYTSKRKIIGMGGSAGGLLMGAVVNQAPELFLGIVMAVPFVDSLTTNLDHSLPLTVGEFDEFGNCIQTKICQEGYRKTEECVGPVEHRAWSIPIYLNYKS